jgi:hypothetical protein
MHQTPFLKVPLPVFKSVLHFLKEPEDMLIMLNAEGNHTDSLHEGHVIWENSLSHS